MTFPKKGWKGVEGTLVANNACDIMDSNAKPKFKIDAYLGVQT